jgi:hypothetical protein
MRLARAISRATQPDPIFPLVLYTLDRGLQREAQGGPRQAVTILDRVFDRAMQRHPRVDRGKILQFIRDSRSFSDEILGRIAPPRLMRLSAGEAIGFADSRLEALFELDLKAVMSPDARKIFEVLSEDDLHKPHITKLSPKKASYEPGESVQLRGSNLNPQNGKITVRLRYGYGDPGLDERLILLPSTKSTSSPSFVLPDDLQLGKVYELNVIREVSGKVYSSNFVSLPIVEPQPLPEVPQPTITDLTPQRRPGDKIIVSGTNFLNPATFALGDRSCVYIEPMDLDGTSPAAWPKAKLLGPTQMEVLLPPDITPGLYRIAVCNIGDGPQFSGTKTSKWVSYQILPHQFQVNFLTMQCIDESNPESDIVDPLFDITIKEFHDTLVTTWAVGADALRVFKCSKDYGGFDDDDPAPYAPQDSAVFSGEVKHGLVLASQLFEWDAGDVKSVTEVIQMFGDIAGDIAKLLADKSPKAAAILMGVKIASPFLQKVIAYFGADADLLGEQSLAFQAADLQKKTQNDSKTFAGELPFLNNDATGSYKLAYEVVRLT